MQTFTGWSDEDIQSIKAPTLLISGDNDVVSPEHSAKMFRLIPHCQLAILPGGHGTYMGELMTLVDGKWEQKYAIHLIEQFLDVP